MKTYIKHLLVALVASTDISTFAQAFGEIANATLDAVRENREQNAAPADIKTIFAKAKEAADGGNVNFCGFYVGMERTDADALRGYYRLYGESQLDGDPLVNAIHFSLVGIQKMMNCGSSFRELCQGVANRVGDLEYVNDFFDGEKWEYKTIGGIVVKIRDNKTVGSANLVNAFVMEDTTGAIKKRSEIRRKNDREIAALRFSESSEKVPECPSMEILLSDDVSMRFRQLPNGCWFGETEVTQEQWEALMGGNPSAIKWAKRPVECVSWEKCQQFIDKFNEQAKMSHSDLVFRLPKPGEWLYACYAGGSGDFGKAANGQEITYDTLEVVAWTAKNSDDQTHPVGKKMANAWGLHDMLGNVEEWGPRDESKNGDVFHVFGGSYRGVYRYGLDADVNLFVSGAKEKYRGFRLCAFSKADELRSKTEREYAQKEQDNAAISSLISDMVQIPKRKYMIGKYEVTQAQWVAIMGYNPSERKGADFPVENISWNACQRFLQKLNIHPEIKAAGLAFRIPTAEEWWHACHAGSSDELGNPSCFLEDGTLVKGKEDPINGSQIIGDSLSRVGWMFERGHSSNTKTHSVGEKTPNAFGLYDMFGNVCEMVDSEVGQYDEYEKHHPDFKICCGGSWKENVPETFFWAHSCINPKLGADHVGFRLCAEKVESAPPKPSSKYSDNAAEETNSADGVENGSSSEVVGQFEPERNYVSVAEKLGISREQLAEIEESPRTLNLDLILGMMRDDGHLAKIINDPISVGYNLWDFMDTTITFESLDRFCGPMRFTLSFCGETKQVYAHTEEDCRDEIIAFVESFPDNSGKDELLKILFDVQEQSNDGQIPKTSIGKEKRTDSATAVPDKGWRMTSGKDWGYTSDGKTVTLTSSEKLRSAGGNDPWALWIPDTIDGKPVTKLSADLCNNHGKDMNLSAVRLPATIVDMGAESFCWHRALKDVYLFAKKAPVRTGGSNFDVFFGSPGVTLHVPKGAEGYGTKWNGAKVVYDLE